MSVDAREKSLDALIRDLGEERGRALALELGAEIREEVEAELRQDHEDDLVRIRARSFDYGVRAALRVLRDTGRIGVEEEDALALRFAAGPTLDLAALHDELVPLLGPGNDDDAARGQADAVVDLLRARVP